MFHVPHPARVQLRAVAFDDIRRRSIAGLSAAGAVLRRSSERLELRLEHTRTAGSFAAVLLLALLAALIVVLGLAVLWFIGTLVFAPQLQMLSHIFFFTPS
jgi:hypothetical protein